MCKMCFSMLMMCVVYISAGAEGRIGEIAALLPEKPSAAGARIGDRVAWGRLSALPSAGECIRNAEKSLVEPIPILSDDLYLQFSRTGNRANYEKRYFARVASLSNLIVGECLENKGRFTGGIIELINAICAERSWTMPAHDSALTSFNGIPHIDLGSASRTLILSFAYDWLGDILPSDTKVRMLAECDRRTFRPYLATCWADTRSRIRQHWWYESRSNWNSVCNSCVVRAALAMVDNRFQRAEFVASAEHTVPFAMMGYTDDGYCSEGMGYWNFGYGHHLFLGLVIRAATGGKVDLFADIKRHRAVMMYPYGYRLMDWHTPHFSDGDSDVKHVLLALQRQVFPDITCSLAASQDLLKGGLSEISLRAFGQDPGQDFKAGDDKPSVRTWFSNAQVLISRGEWPVRKMRMSLAIKGGHNAELHNHNDIGSYVIMLDGVEMCGDPGSEVYTRRTFSRERYASKIINSYGHPVPVVGGNLQECGRSSAAKVLRTEFTEVMDVLELDCTAAYDVPSLKSLVRTMKFDRSAGSVDITDRVIFSEPTSFEVPVITYREYSSDDKATCLTFRKMDKDGCRSLRMNVQSSAPVAFREDRINNPGRPCVKRLAFAFTNPVTDATLTFAYSTTEK